MQQYLSLNAHEPNAKMLSIFPDGLNSCQTYEPINAYNANGLYDDSLNEKKIDSYGMN